jgi:ABC-2 type transport system ATP-binding protein
MGDAGRELEQRGRPGAGYSVVVEGLGRRFPTSRAAYAAPKTIWSRFLGGGSGGAGAADDDDEDEEEVLEAEPEERLDRWALRDVSFALEPGRALAVIGESGSGADVLMRVLASMLPPTAGSVAFAGRATPTTELATALTRIDASPKYHARLLAMAAHVPRAGRAQWIEEIAAFAQVTGKGRAASSDRALLTRRMAVAASIDPTADVLLVDDLPALGDPGFRDRCLARLGSALERGATAIVAGPESSPMLEFCQEAILLADGTIDRWGSPAELIHEHRRRTASNPFGHPRRSGRRSLPGFNEYASIHGVRGGEGADIPTAEAGSTVVCVEVETAFHDTEIAVSLLLRSVDDPEEDAVHLQQDPVLIPDPGRYLVTSSLDSSAGVVVPAAVEVVIGVHSRGLRTEIGRRSGIALWADASEPELEDATQAPPSTGTARPFADLRASWRVDWIPGSD